MDKRFFAEQIKKLVIEYEDKGFTMTTERLNQWYVFFKDTSEKRFEDMVDNCLIECVFPPTMANLFKGS